MQKFKTTNNKCVIYARFSCHNQTEQSIEGQINDCQKFAELHNLQIVGTYIDRALTATSDKRPEFQRMIADSEQRIFDIVLVWKLDRFSRDRYDSAVYKNKLKKNGVRVMSAMENIADSPDGILLESILEGYAEYFSRDLSQKVTRGMRETAKKHKVTGTIPFGYKKSDEGTYIPDENTAPIVKRIFEMYADGIINKDIVKYLNSRGYRTTTGRPFVNQTLHKLLSRRRYTGHYSYGDLELHDENQRIIDDELFAKVQKKLQVKRHTGGASKAKEPYLLSSKLYCGYCKQPLHGEAGTGKSGAFYQYYKCRTNKKGGSCIKSTEKKKTVEDFAINNTLNAFLNKELISLITAAVKKSQETDATSARILNIKSQLDATNKKIKNILAAIEAGIFSPTTQERLTELEELKEKLEYDLDMEKVAKGSFNINSFLSFLNSVDASDFQSSQEKQRLLNNLLYREYLWNDKVLFIYNFTNRTYNDDLNIDDVIKSIETCSNTTPDGVPKNPDLSFDKSGFFEFYFIFTAHSTSVRRPVR